MIFGSSIYDPAKARDLDLLVIINKLEDLAEKHALEIEVAKILRRICPKKLAGVIVFDEESFRENLEPGGLSSGLIAGYKAIYDELGLDDLINELAEKIAGNGYLVQKGGRRINLSALAKMRLRLSGARSEEAGGRDQAHRI